MKKTRAFISALLLTVMTAALTTSCSAGGTSQVSYDRDVTSEVRDAVSQAAEESELLPDTELENKTVKWLATWDINPDGTGKNKPTELVVFEEKYGGKIEWIPCTWENRYERLAEVISSGDGADLFAANDGDAFPKGAVKSMFAPVDEYIDFSSPLWEDVQELNDGLLWADRHYMVVTQVVGDKVACVYNRKTIQEAGLEDPADLYRQGRWDWDTFEKMLKAFVDPEKQHYGLEGWWFEFALMNTTGVPAIGLEDGKLVNNLSDPAMERVQNLLYDLNSAGCVAIGVGDYGWDSHPEYVGEGKVLFYPVGLYEFYKEPGSWKTRYGEDAFFVPMPRDPKADEYYIPVGMEAYAFITGGNNPEGAARFLDCKRFVMMDDTVGEVADKQFREDYGWTDEMVDMQHELQDLAEANTFFDFSAGASKDCEELLDQQLRAAAKQGVPWNETFDSIDPVVQTLIDDINADPIQSAE